MSDKKKNDHYIVTQAAVERLKAQLALLMYENNVSLQKVYLLVDQEITGASNEDSK